MHKIAVQGSVRAAVDVTFVLQGTATEGDLMTTTVKRGAGRPAAAARTRKHAQREPQPRIHTTEAIVDEAKVPQRAKQRENFEAAIAVEKGGYGRMTVPELKARLTVLGGGKPPRGISRMSKGDLLNGILQAERAAKSVAQPAQEEPKQAPSSHVADGARVSGEGADPKGKTKADKLQNALYPHGWAFQERNYDGDRVEAVLTRGSEVLTVVWNAGVFNYEETGHLVGDRHTKVRNVSAAIKLGSRSAEEAEADLNRVVANRRFKMSEPRTAPKRHGGVPVRRGKLPFDPAEVSDDLLWHALMGKTVEWVNRVSNATEVATVSKSPAFWRVIGTGADRTIQFTCETGFRACRLDQIVRVGGSARRRTQPKAVAA